VEVVLGAVAGAVAGVVGGVVSAIVQITYKRRRNDRLIRRGEPPIKDVIFTPLYPVHALAGLIAGGLMTELTGGTWITGAIAGTGLPAVATVGWTIACVAQLRR